MIMERPLLAKDGIIVADNVLAKGCTVDSKIGRNTSDSALQNAVELRKFNDHIKDVACFFLNWLTSGRPG